MPAEVRPARPADAPRIAEIYNAGIAERSSTFETDPRGTGKLFAENEASVRLVTRNGWREVGLHLRHGRLDGDWRDVLVMERLLNQAPAPEGGASSPGA